MSVILSFILALILTICACGEYTTISATKWVGKWNLSIKVKQYYIGKQNGGHHLVVYSQMNMFLWKTSFWFVKRQLILTCVKCEAIQCSHTPAWKRKLFASIWFICPWRTGILTYVLMCHCAFFSTVVAIGIVRIATNVDRCDLGIEVWDIMLDINKENWERSRKLLNDRRDWVRKKIKNKKCLKL